MPLYEIVVDYASVRNSNVVIDNLLLHLPYCILMFVIVYLGFITAMDQQSMSLSCS
jgi:hypothetical protein